MKVVLFGLNGSFSHSNLAIRRLRPFLEADGFTVVLSEAGLRDGDASLLESLVFENADIYGFSCYIWNISRMLELAKNLRSLRPDALIIFGGPEVSYDTERFDGCAFIDCIITGAGESALVEVCSAFRDGRTVSRLMDGGDTGLSEGILYRADEPVSNTLYYESAVGCPFSCSFCLSSASCGVKAKSSEQTLSELKAFEQLGGDRTVKFVDRTFNFDKKRAIEIWRGLLSPEYTKRYHFEVCASLLDDEAFETLKQFPVGKIQLEAGLQSTNPQTLNAVARHLDVDKTLSACRKIMSFGNIHVHFDLIAGLPYEGYSSFSKSFNEAYPCCHQLQLGFLKLLHGTALRKDADKYGYIFTSEPPYTVLQNNWMSYAELRRLDVISDLLERFKNSQHFESTLEYALPFSESPFAFYEGLADFIAKNDGRGIRKISQNDAYALLFGFASTLPSIDIDRLDILLHGDFTKNEVRRVPHFKKSKDFT